MSNGSDGGETRTNFKALLVIALVGLTALSAVAVFIANQMRPKAPVGNPPISLWAGLSIDHPTSLLLARSGESVSTTGVISACDPGFDYCLHVPSSANAGTNFMSAGIRVNERPDIAARLSCLASQPDGFSTLQPAVRDSPTYATSRFGDVGQGAAGSVSHGELRRIFVPGRDSDPGSCVEFELRVAHSQFSNHPAGSIQEFSAADVTSVTSALQDALARVRLADGERVAWPSKDSSSMEAFIRVDSLSGVARVTSPIRLEGVATGAWFFEGSFPLYLESADGELIAESYATAKGEWMTEELVPFSGEISFSVSELQRATLVLLRDNPSDLPQHDAALRFEIELLP
ncbi:MAG: hypothetical protein KF813_06705 [Trueperaceae bacterium]|nr:hypothetical protein [Trueperaceae bacterium]